MSKLNFEIKSSISNFLNYKISNGALLIDGEWGSGKTYFVQNEIIPELIENKGTNVVYISLFGLSSGLELKNSILLKSIIDNGSKNNGVAKIKDRVSKMISKFEVLTKFVSALEVSDLVEFEKIIYVFDDLERVRDKNLLLEFMGIISSGLIEKNKYKVILIGNLNKLKSEDFFLYQEKFISRILEFKSNPSDVVSNIVKKIELHTEILKQVESESKFIEEMIQYFHISNFRAISQSFDLLVLVSNNIKMNGENFNLLRELIFFVIVMNNEFRGSDAINDEMWDSLPLYSFLGEWPFLSRSYRYIDYSKGIPTGITRFEREARIQSIRYFTPNSSNETTPPYWEPVFFKSIYQLIIKGGLDINLLNEELEELSKVRESKIKNQRYTNVNALYSWKDLRSHEYDEYKTQAIGLLNQSDLPVGIFFQIVELYMSIHETQSELIKEVSIAHLINAYKNHSYVNENHYDEFYLNLKYRIGDYPSEFNSILKEDIKIVENREKIKRSKEIIDELSYYHTKDNQKVLNLLTFCDPEMAANKIIEFITAKQFGYSNFVSSLEDVIKSTSFQSKGRIAFENIEEILNAINKKADDIVSNELDKYRLENVVVCLDKIASLYKAFTVISDEGLKINMHENTTNTTS